MIIMIYKIIMIVIMEFVEMEVCFVCGGVGVFEIIEKKRSVISLFLELCCLNYYLFFGCNVIKV